MKHRAFKNLFTVVLAVITAAVTLLSGCSLSSRNWFKSTIKTYYYYEVDDAAFKSGSLKEIAYNYLDAYSDYYTAEEYTDVLKSNAGSKSGFGFSYAYINGRGVYISSVTGNSPAYICGLRAGEYIVSGSVGDGEVEFSSSDDFRNFVSSAGENTVVNLNSYDGITYSMLRAEYTASYAYMATCSTGWIFGDSADGGLALYEKTDEKISYLPEGFAYIKLSQFYGTAAGEFYSLIEKFKAQNCTSLILDLRSNGGGYVSVMQEIAYAFSGDTKQLAMLSRDKHGKEEKFYCTKTDKSVTLPENTAVYVLANAGTASASEALIGAMVCYGDLTYNNIFLSDYSENYLNWLKESGQQIKNARSYGKGIMQSTFRNNMTGEALKLTTAQIYWPDGKTCIHDKGLTLSDGCTAVAAEWQHTKSDLELLTAVEIITSR